MYKRIHSDGVARDCARASETVRSDLRPACDREASLPRAVRSSLRQSQIATCGAGFLAVALSGIATVDADGLATRGALLVEGRTDSRTYSPRSEDVATEGFVLNGIDEGDQSGGSCSGVGDVNNDGLYDLIIGADAAGRQDAYGAGESYVVFGRMTGFPSEFELSSLLPRFGGNGSTGFVLLGVEANDASGVSVSGAGDINGDGFDDVVIGADRADRFNGDGAGEAYVVFGRATGFPPGFWLSSLFPQTGGDGTEGFVLQGVVGGTRLGEAVAGAGDVNADGIEDLIVGAPAVNALGRLFIGASYVVFGRRTFPAVFDLRGLLPQMGGDGSMGFVLNGVDGYDQSASAVDGAGDVNGDGIGDLVIGAWGADHHGRSRAGETYVVFGRAAGFQAVFELRSLFPQAGGDGTAGFAIQGIDSVDSSGQWVSGAGDVNSDGTDDILIGAYLADPAGRNQAGESYVVFGRTAGFPPTLELRSLLPGGGGDGHAGFVLQGVDEGDTSGPVAGAGDVNGDGIDDLIIGARDAAPHGLYNAGESYVVFGRTTGFPPIFDLRSLFPQTGGDGTTGVVLKGAGTADRSGSSVAGVGDVNGDGVDDLITGAPDADPHDRMLSGASYVVFGRTTGFPAVLELGDLLPP